MWMNGKMKRRMKYVCFRVSLKSTWCNRVIYKCHLLWMVSIIWSTLYYTKNPTICEKRKLSSSLSCGELTQSFFAIYFQWIRATLYSQIARIVFMELCGGKNAFIFISTHFNQCQRQWKSKEMKGSVDRKTETATKWINGKCKCLCQWKHFFFIQMT